MPFGTAFAALDLLELVHTVSGYPAVVTANRDLPTAAALRMARGPALTHANKYIPERAAEPDYWAALPPLGDAR